MSKNWQIFKYVFLLFLGWRLALLLITYLGISVIPTINPVERTLFFPSANLDFWGRWANWDGGHYLSIAQQGYQAIQTGFFPAYPLAIKLFTLLGLPALWSALLISQTSIIIALFYLYKLALMDFGEKVAKRVVFIFLIFPTSFYMGAVYSEGLFIATSIASFYYARNKRWFLAASLAGLAGITRWMGLAVIGGLFAEYLFKENISFRLNLIWQTIPRRLLVYLLSGSILLQWILNILISQHNLILIGVIFSVNQLLYYPLLATGFIVVGELFIKLINFSKILSKNFIRLFIAFVPLIGYLIFQWQKFGTPFSFLTDAATSWGKVLTAPWQAPLYNLYTLYSRNFFEIGDNGRILFHFLVFLLFFGGLLVSLYKLRLSYVGLIFLSLLIPLLSGTLMDLPRYALTIFPIFLLFAQIENELVQKVGVIISVLLLSFLSILFINSYWYM